MDMLPRVEPVEENTSTLRALTEGVHSREAIDMVKEHVLAVLGPASMAFANTMIKMSKLQAAQVQGGGWCLASGAVWGQAAVWGRQDGPLRTGI